MSGCGCGGAARQVVWRVERPDEPAREFATAADALAWDNARGGDGDVYPVSR